MVLKGVDDKRKILDSLKVLEKHPKLYSVKRSQVRQLLSNLEKGWRNEREAAYYIDSYYRNSERCIIIHDLRLVTKEESVQIDHLLLFPTTGVVLESKYFSSPLHYDPKNREFFIYSKNRRPISIPDPVKQAERQKLGLQRILEQKGLEGYFPPISRYYGIISPKVKFYGKMPPGIVKADHFRDLLVEEERVGFGEALVRAFLGSPLLSPERIKVGAEKLLTLHRPFTLDYFLRQLKLEWTKEWILEQLSRRG